MIEKAINKILELGEHKIMIHDGRTYVIGPSGVLPLPPPKAETLAINTLTGIIDYGVDPDKQMIHVFDKRVNVIGKEYSDEWLTINTYLTAVNESPIFRFGQFMDVENFIISIQAMFVQDDNTEAILRIVGNIKDESVTQYNDDGVTQAVTARAGISRVEQVPLPNPVTLRPYRTFMEVEQPASTFVFRMQGTKGAPPQCGLLEADGRRWRLEAIRNIKEWLNFKIPGVKIIA